MNDTPAAVSTLLIILAITVPTLWWQHGRAKKHDESTRDRIIREAYASTRVWDTDLKQWIELPAGVKPGPRQLPEDEVAEIRELRLLFEAPAYDAELAAGCDRLRQAIHDEPQKGDQP